MSYESEASLQNNIVEDPVEELQFPGGILGAVNTIKNITITETGQSNATVTTNLEAGVNIGVGNVTVTGSGANRSVEFISALALTEVLDAVFDGITGTTILTTTDAPTGGPQETLSFTVTGNFNGKITRLQQRVVDDSPGPEEWIDVSDVSDFRRVQTLGLETITAEKLTAGNITDPMRLLVL